MLHQSTLNGHTLGYLSEDFKIGITLHKMEKQNTNQVNVLFKSFQLYGYTHLVYAQIRNIQLNILRGDLTRGVRGEIKVVETKSRKKPSGLMTAGKHKSW